MNKHIFKDFLDDEVIYQKNVAFWKLIITGLLEPENYKHREYIATSDGYGNEFCDGNPIANFKIDELKKGVRIIQEEPGNSAKKFTAWIKETKLANEEKIDELVINLELTIETIYLTINLINAWIISDLTKFRMKRYIKTLSNLMAQVSGLQEAEIV